MTNHPRKLSKQTRLKVLINPQQALSIYRIYILKNLSLNEQK